MNTDNLYKEALQKIVTRIECFGEMNTTLSENRILQIAKSALEPIPQPSQTDKTARQILDKWDWSNKYEILQAMEEYANQFKEKIASDSWDAAIDNLNNNPISLKTAKETYLSQFK